MTLLFQSYNYPLIVIGAGAAGLVVAIGAAKAGKKVLLAEAGHYGGDCTNFGCIPSKSLIAAAEAAYHAHHLSDWGIKGTVSDFNGAGALKRTRGIVKEILSHETPEALEKLGVETLTGKASFMDPHTLRIEEKDGTYHLITAKNCVIATGSRPIIPKIDGLSNIPYLTNETLFSLKEIPRHLAILGGGPIGVEMAQAFRRLGAEVTLIQSSDRLLPKDDPHASEAITTQFKKEGIGIHCDAHVTQVAPSAEGIELRTDKQQSIACSHLLVATGRQPSVHGLNLESAGVNYTSRGIPVDGYGRTTQPNIWAVGDITGRALFTHAAENEARTVLRNILAPWLFRAKIDTAQPVPHVTYTDPEVASVGMTEAEAIKAYGSRKISTYCVPFAQLDRAICAGRTEGFVNVVTFKWSSRIIGATIVAPRAGEMLMEISVAMQHRIPLRKLASLIHPYPTYSLAIRKAADLWFSKTILPILLKLAGK